MTQAASTLPTAPRRMRVVKPTEPAEAKIARQPSSHLAPDSLGWSLVLAARVLNEVRNGRSLSEALTSLSNQTASARAAAQEIAYGVLRSYGRGEFFLSRLMQKPLSHTETQALLLAALYRLESRAGSPAAVAMVVDQAVMAAGEISGGVFKGVVNGVLRNYLRQKNALHGALASNEEALWQHPRWWVDRLRRLYPEQWENLLRTANTQAPMSLRVNVRKNTLADYQAQLNACNLAAKARGSTGLILEKSLPVDALPDFASGAVSVQDIGAQRAAELLSPEAGTYVLDACAAPGGKTSHLLETADLELVALDIDAQRALRIEQNLQRLGLTAKVCVADCRQPEQWWDGRFFDAILADVPCSASGVVRRHPDIKTLRRESDIHRLKETQAEILDTLWRLLKPGGKLLYASCSIFPEENSGQIDAFLVRAPDARVLLSEQWLPEEEHDGFYYALLRKESNSNGS